VLIPEIPGLTPEVLVSASTWSPREFTVVIPSPSVRGRGPETMGVRAGHGGSRVCLQGVPVLRGQRRASITKYLGAVANDLAARTPGRGVGVIGMCFTGGFALATGGRGRGQGAVLSQPSTPFPVSARLRRDPGLSTGRARGRQGADPHRRAVRARPAVQPRPVSPSERITTLRAQLGDAFEVIELDSAPGNPDGYGR
jgi:hypothetical protein